MLSATIFDTFGKDFEYFWQGLFMLSARIAHAFGKDFCTFGMDF